MAIINRAALKAQFRSGSIPTGQEYSNLIDSMLVKRDDAFFGKWQPGLVYRPGDVVIYDKAIFVCITQQDDPCGCDDKGKEKTPKTVDPAKKGFCSRLPPGKKGADAKEYDTINWQLLELDIEDEDWGIIRAGEGGQDIMYAKVFGKIGIGTQDPKARVHIHDEELQADFLFSPDNASVPELRISKADIGPEDLSISLTDNKARFETGTEGFLFRLPGVAPGPNDNQDATQTPVDTSSQVFVTAVNNKPAIGLGTLTPLAEIDMKDGLSRNLLLNPHNRIVPEILWSHRSGPSQVCLSVSANDKNAQLCTNASGGFLFQSGIGDDCDAYIKDGSNQDGKALLSVSPEAKVGIGTDNPAHALDIRDPDNNSGSFLLSFKKTNPALAIVNIRPGGASSNYLTIGADNEKAILITDAEDGFVFKKGYEFGKYDNEVNINQGTALMKITSKGKVGLGDGSKPENYELDVFGNTRMFSLYITTGEDKISDNGSMQDMLIKLKKLRPIKFQWKKGYAFEDKEQYGFLAHEVEDIMPELIKESDDTKAIAYPNLVAVAVKAIQEQQDIIDKLKKTTEDLEKRIRALEANVKK